MVPLLLSALVLAFPWSAHAQAAPPECPSGAMGTMEGGGMRMSSNPMDAVALGDDLDGDGDPDELTICLQILELNQEIAPGITLPFWVFAPDLGGMDPPARLPGPTIRVEEGDRVHIVVQNTHYFPHTLHLHGVAKPNAMDGVPHVTQEPIKPGEAFTYTFTARNPGTYWYHCHVQPPVHILMGLYGMLVIEPDRPQNFVTPLVTTARMPELSAASQEAGFDAEYALAYGDIDPALHAPLQDAANGPAQLEWELHRNYNPAAREPRYFVVNGRSFPYTLLDSMVRVRPESRTLLRVLNAGARTVSLHTHGHRVEVAARDGTPVPEDQRELRDTVTITPGQRVDLVLDTRAEAGRASGPGVWLLHDHTEEAITTDGINPGGDLNYIVYPDFIDAYGLPKVSGDLSRYFEPAYYRGQRSVFQGAPFEDAPPGGRRDEVDPLDRVPLWGWIALLAVAGLLLGGALGGLLLRWTRTRPQRGS